MNPLEIFNTWLAQETKASTTPIPEACCFSTIGTDGYPNARFVSLKEVKDGAFIITGSTVSRKGWETRANNRVALTFWWPYTQRQVRVQGVAEMISDAEADKYFNQRSKEAQTAVAVSRQGAILRKEKELTDTYNAALRNNQNITRPAEWKGYRITPLRIELMQFEINRLHRRTLYEHDGKLWHNHMLQP